MIQFISKNDLISHDFDMAYMPPAQSLFWTLSLLQCWNLSGLDDLSTDYLLVEKAKDSH